jgi:prophage regulatory protein
MDSETLLRLPAVLKQTGLARSTLYARIADGSFPKPLALTERCRAWPQSVVDTWIQAKIKAAG